MATRPEPAPIRHRRKPLDVSYRACHQRVRTRRGPASAHRCAGCGRRPRRGSTTATTRTSAATAAAAGSASTSTIPAALPVLPSPRRRRPPRRAAARRRWPRSSTSERAARLYRAGASSTGIAALLPRQPRPQDSSPHSAITTYQTIRTTRTTVPSARRWREASPPTCGSPPSSGRAGHPLFSSMWRFPWGSAGGAGSRSVLAQIAPPMLSIGRDQGRMRTGRTWRW